MQKVNLLRTWRGQRNMAQAASDLHVSERTYRLLETEPRKSTIKSDTIIRISRVTGISLEELVDYLTETNTIVKGE